MKLFPNFTRHHLITHTYFAVFSFEASFASANVVLLGIPHVARSAVQAGLTGAKILLKETQFQLIVTSASGMMNF